MLGARRAAGDDDERHALGVRLSNRAERVLDARTVLAAKHGDLIAGAQATDRVGHGATDALLAHDERTYVDCGSRLRERIQRVRE